MSSSRIHFHDRFIDTSDAAMEVWLRLVVGAIDAMPHPPKWLTEAREDWNAAATMGFGFGVIPELSTFVTGEERRQVVLDLCEAAQERLRQLGDPIPAATLNSLGAGPPGSHFQRDLPASLFRDVAVSFTALVRDTPLR